MRNPGRVRVGRGLNFLFMFFMCFMRHPSILSIHTVSSFLYAKKIASGAFGARIMANCHCVHVSLKHKFQLPVTMCHSPCITE